MKLVITVTDGQAAVSTEATGAGTREALSSDGRGEPQLFDGGPVPEVLLSMEGEVAAGHRPPPGQSH